MLRDGELKSGKLFRGAAKLYLRKFEIITQGQRGPTYARGQHARTNGDLIAFSAALCWFSPEEYKQLYEATRNRAHDPKQPRLRWEAKQLHDYVFFSADIGPAQTIITTCFMMWTVVSFARAW